jgi:predicted RNA-binding protein with RPS1 domain
VEDAVKVGDELNAKVIKLSLDERKIGLSMRENAGEGAE